MLVVDISGLNKSFTRDKRALKDVRLQVREGEMVALIGASGSGKSTLIRHIAGLLRGDRDGGKIAVFGETIQENGKIARGARKVRADIGVIFQQFNLVSRLTVLTNVLMGLLGRVPSWRGSFCMFTKAERMRAMGHLPVSVLMGTPRKRRVIFQVGSSSARQSHARLPKVHVLFWRTSRLHPLIRHRRAR